MHDSKFAQLFLIILICWTPFCSYTQCPSAQAGYLSGQQFEMGINDTSSIPVFTSTPSGLPNTEFIFIHANSIADDGLGPAMIDTDTIGVFVPSQLGLTYCDEVHVIPFSYDLSQVRELVDSLLFAYFLAPTTTCCDASAGFFPGLCDTINALGIYSGNDVHSLDDLIKVLSVFIGTGGVSTTSLQNLTISIDMLNSLFPLLGSCAGTVGEICYAVADSSMAKDMYQIRLSSASSDIDLAGDTIIFNGQLFTLNVSYTPSTSTDSLIWYTDSIPTTILVDSIGQLSSAGITDTTMVYVNGYFGCGMDSVLVIADPSLHLIQLNDLFLDIFPNPTFNQLHIRSSINHLPIHFSIVDLHGRQLDSGTRYEDRFQLDVNSLERGFYHIVLRSNNKAERATFYKM